MSLTMRLTGLLCLALIADTACASVTEDDVNRAYYQSDTAILETLRANLNEEFADEALLAGYVDWRLASIHVRTGNEDAADDALERGQATLEKLVEKIPEDAEGWALLSSTLGMRIGIRPMTRGFRYGRAADAAIGRALALEPANPRVLLIDGIGKLSKPALFGGNTEGAIAALDHALASVAANGTGRYLWGEADAYVWRGIAHDRAGKPEAAIQDFDQALAAVPSYEWAKVLRDNVDTD